MNERKFFVCPHCGNIIGMINDSGVTPVCCGERMTAMTANTVEASREKHLPVVEHKDGCLRVEVGSVAHPMTEEHSILWVYLETDRGGQRKALPTLGAPVVTFALADEKPIAVYAYCNLHGLWRTDI